MVVRGVAHGNRIDLDEALPVADGTRVTVNIVTDSNPRKGSPRAVLQLAGTLSEEEAEAILRAAQECRRIDPSLWVDRS